jgi:hypothetical protein
MALPPARQAAGSQAAACPVGAHLLLQVYFEPCFHRRSADTPADLAQVARSRLAPTLDTPLASGSRLSGAPRAPLLPCRGMALLHLLIGLQDRRRDVQIWPRQPLRRWGIPPIREGSPSALTPCIAPPNAGAQLRPPGNNAMYPQKTYAVGRQLRWVVRHKARQSFLYISAELTRLTLGAYARSAAIAGRDGMRSSNT